MASVELEIDKMNLPPFQSKKMKMRTTNEQEREWVYGTSSRSRSVSGKHDSTNAAVTGTQELDESNIVEESVVASLLTSS
jgi:hypothetical protein